MIVIVEHLAWFQRGLSKCSYFGMVIQSRYMYSNFVPFLSEQPVKNLVQMKVIFISLQNTSLSHKLM